MPSPACLALRLCGWLVAAVTAAVVALVRGITYGIAAHGSQRSTDGGSFETTAALMADNATSRRSTQTAQNGASPGIGAGGAGRQEETKGTGKREMMFHNF